MKTTLQWFEAALKRLSPGLRCRYDSKTHRYVLDQKDYKGRWMFFKTICGPQNSFRLPSQQDLAQIRRADSRRYILYRGKYNKLMQRKFESRLGSEASRDTTDLRKELRERIDQDLRPKIAWAVKQTGLWRHLSWNKNKFARAYAERQMFWDRVAGK